MSSSDFYLRYYVGHKGKFGHEFLEFEFRPDGELYSAAPTAFSFSFSFSLVSITIIGAQHKWSVQIYKLISMYVHTHRHIFIHVYTRLCI